MILSGHDSVFFHSVAALPRWEISVSTGKQASGNRKVFLPAIRVTTVMKTNQASRDRSHPDGRQYSLRREANSWEETSEGQQATFKHELGAN
jgi:hypothetical protein